MISRKPFYAVVALLFLAGLALSLYRHFAFEIPWLPGEQRQIWSIEAKVEFDAGRGPVRASLAIPETQKGFTRLNETAASPGYGLSFIGRNGGTRAEWTIREASGPQELYYRVDMMADPNAEPPESGPVPKIAPHTDQEPYATAIRQVLNRALERSADGFSLTRELIRELGSQQQNAELLAQYRETPTLLVEMLNRAGIAARVVKGLVLEDGRRRQTLIDLLQVFDGNRVEVIDPATGQPGLGENVLLWERHSMPVLDLMGGTNSRVTFSMISQQQPVNLALDQKFEASSLLNFSIHSLPLEEQALFKGILLIPIGVLVVVLMRVVVGLKTSGTFMPVLIAMAFIQTSLVTGLIGFLLIVSMGLVIRSYLSHLNLLLVARISTVIIMVIGIISLFSVLAFKLGLTEGLKITFFPMIILSWTIERMSLLWEEEGAKEVLAQGGGSLLVAVLAYLAMNNELIRHLTFNFLGLQLVVMAAVLLLGNYTCYRLLELNRFQPLARED